MDIGVAERTVVNLDTLRGALGRGVDSEVMKLESQVHISPEQIEAVKAAHPLADVVPRYAKWDKQTRKWLCPFHDEKSGSLWRRIGSLNAHARWQLIQRTKEVRSKY